jgi:hypothetical protein
MAMRNVGLGFITALALFSAFTVSAKETRLTDDAIAQILIEDSISSYPKNCPCPYNSASNGSRCGKRSAYNRAGGYSPLCFKEDVTKGMVQEYRERVKG